MKERCEHCVVKEALPNDDLCQECREDMNEVSDRVKVVYKIPWKKYNAENRPEKGVYLVCHIGGVTSANIKAEGWQSYNGHWLFDVTHYAPINLPGDETV